jgi:hypothetical protein
MKPTTPYFKIIVSKIVTKPLVIKHTEVKHKMNAVYILKCVLKKCMKQKMTIVMVALALIIAAEGFLIVVSVARARELKEPWYRSRSVNLIFDNPILADSVYEVFSRELREGKLNGFALIADADTSGGVSLGGLEGNLWKPFSEADDIYATDESIFWIHQNVAPEKFFYRLDMLTGQINGSVMKCDGLSNTGLNWHYAEELGNESVTLRLDGETASQRDYFRDYLYNEEEEEWDFYYPIITGAKWMVKKQAPIVGACITLTEPYDVNTLQRISNLLPVTHKLDKDWNYQRIGSISYNEWTYFGVLLFAMVNIASLYFGLIDGLAQEFSILRKIGARQFSIHAAIALLAFLLSALVFAIAFALFNVFIYSIQEADWLSILPRMHVLLLFCGFSGVSVFLSFTHTRSVSKTMLNERRKKCK